MALRGGGAVPADLVPRLRLARDRIDRDYRSDLDLDGLAAVAGISKFYRNAGQCSVLQAGGEGPRGSAR
ncbi:hypothetical protein [Microbispora sp. NBC_01389]|uniref:hypothetical protein n=1 Tax=Microbispora sp. NBC_01389 TaxID=2903584 RepID=UPI00324F5902